MINLRYHIVSITAVFLALGIGVALGSTLIQRGLVDNLNDRLDEQAERLDRTDGENAALRADLEEIERLEQQLTVEGVSLYDEHLADVPVVIVTAQGVDEALVERTRASLRAADARTLGVLRFTMRWEELDDSEIAELAELTGRPLADAGGARTRTLRDVAQEMVLASEPAPVVEDDTADGGADTGGDATGEGTADDPAADTGAEGIDAGGVVDESGEDVAGEVAPEETTTTTVPEPNGLLLAALIERGYVEFLPDAASAPLPDADARFVLVHDAASDLPVEAAMLPLLEELAAADPAPVVLAETLPEPDGADETSDGDEPTDDAPPVAGPLVTAVRADPQMSLSITTTDVASRFIGQSAVVLGLAQLAGPAPQVGHYGVAVGASSLLPSGAG